MDRAMDSGISTQELQDLRHELRDQLQGLNMGLRVLREAVRQRNWQTAEYLVAQMRLCVHKLERERFIYGEWPAQWPRE